MGRFSLWQSILGDFWKYPHLHHRQLFWTPRARVFFELEIWRHVHTYDWNSKDLGKVSREDRQECEGTNWTSGAADNNLKHDVRQGSVNPIIMCLHYIMYVPVIHIYKFIAIMASDKKCSCKSCRGGDLMPGIIWVKLVIMRIGPRARKIDFDK